ELVFSRRRCSSRRESADNMAPRRRPRERISPLAPKCRRPSSLTQFAGSRHAGPHLPCRQSTDPILLLMISSHPIEILGLAPCILHHVAKTARSAAASSAPSSCDGNR